MHIIEFALINIRHFKEAKKITLKPGLNLILGENGSGKSTLFSAFRDIFFPGYEHYPRDGASQGAISFKADDGEIYRILRHFSKQSVQLYQLDAKSGKFVLIEKEETAVQNRILALFNLQAMTRDQITSYFFIDRQSLPSCRLRDFSRREQSISPVSRPESDAAARESLERLKKEEAQADQLAQKESEMLDYKDRIFTIKRTLSELDAVENGLTGIAEREKSFPGFSGIPKEIEKIMEDYEKGEAEKSNEERQLVEERDFIVQQLSMDQQNLLQNKFLWAGAAITGIALLLPFVIDVEGFLKQMDLIGLLFGIGLALFSLFKDFSKISQRKIWSSKLENKNKNIEMLNVRFQREHAKYFTILQRTGTANREQFESRFSDYRRLKEEENDLVRKKNAILSNKSKETLLAELIEASEKAEISEKEIGQLKPGTRDPYAIQQEIKALEESLSAGSAMQAFDSAVTGPLPGAEVAEREKPELLSGFFERDWELLNKIGGTSTEPLDRRIQSRLAGLKGTGIVSTGERGNLALDPPDSRLSPGVSDYLFLLLFLIRLEILQSVPFPLFIDDSLSTIDPARQTFVLNRIRELSQFRQVVFLGSSGYTLDVSASIRL